MNKSDLIKYLLETEKTSGLAVALHQVFGSNVKVRLGFSKLDCNANIEALMLSVRSCNALCRAHIFTLGDLIDRLDDGSLKNVRNLGAKSYSEIQTKILVYGFEQLSQSEKIEFLSSVVESNDAVNEWRLSWQR